jgi:hypothetical protein
VSTILVQIDTDTTLDECGSDFGSRVVSSMINGSRCNVSALRCSLWPMIVMGCFERSVQTLMLLVAHDSDGVLRCSLIVGDTVPRDGSRRKTRTLCAQCIAGYRHVQSAYKANVVFTA